MRHCFAVVSRVRRRARAVNLAILVTSSLLVHDALAAPTVSAPRLLVDAPESATAVVPEQLVGNGRQVFGAYVEALGGDRAVLHGTYLDETLTPSILAGVPISGRGPAALDPGADRGSVHLAMNQRGTVMGVYGSDLFRVDLEGAVRSLDLQLDEAPAALVFERGADRRAVLVGGVDEFALIDCSLQGCMFQILDDAGAVKVARRTLFELPASATGPEVLVSADFSDEGFRVVLAVGSTVVVRSFGRDGTLAEPATLQEPATTCGAEVRVLDAQIGHVGASRVVRLGLECPALEDSIVMQLDADTGAPSGVGDACSPGVLGRNACRLVASGADLFGVWSSSVRNAASQQLYPLLDASSAAVAATGMEGHPLVVAAGNRTLYSLQDPAADLVAAEAAWRPRHVDAYLLGLDATVQSNPEVGADGLTGTFRFDAELQSLTTGNRTGLDQGRDWVDVTAIERGALTATTDALFVHEDSVVREVPFDGVRALWRNGGQVLALALKGSRLHSYLIDPVQLSDAPGGIAGLPVGFLETSVILPRVAGGLEAVDMAFAGERGLVVAVVDGQLQAAWIDTRGLLVGAPFVLVDHLYSQSMPRVLARPDGSFFLTWTSFRKGTADADIYAGHLAVNARVLQPEAGFAVARGLHQETRARAVNTADAEHVAVLWTDARETANPRARSQIHGAFVTQAGRVRPSFAVSQEGGDKTLVALTTSRAPATELVAYYNVQGGPLGGQRTYARTVSLPKSIGASCATADECITDVCDDGLCVDVACSDPCAVLDAGSCVAAPAGSAPRAGRCEGYVCDGVSTDCPDGCQTDAQCSAGARCSDGECVIERRCSSDLELVSEGVTSSCAPYRCDAVAANCFSSCQTSDECAPGSLCGLDHTCQAPPPPDEGGCSTSAPASHAELAGGWLLALGLLAALRRTRNPE